MLAALQKVMELLTDHDRPAGRLPAQAHCFAAVIVIGKNAVQRRDARKRGLCRRPRLRGIRREYHQLEKRPHMRLDELAALQRRGVNVWSRRAR